jgi:pimeloyl-ACP methyl ester carboxylesterase
MQCHLSDTATERKTPCDSSTRLFQQQTRTASRLEMDTGSMRKRAETRVGNRFFSSMAVLALAVARSIAAISTLISIAPFSSTSVAAAARPRLGRRTPIRRSCWSRIWSTSVGASTSRIGFFFGGSWGATLALCYARAYPERVSAMVLRGSFLARPTDLEWFFGANGAARVFSDTYGAFVHLVPSDERSHLIRAYHQRIHGTDEHVATTWARSWATWGNQAATWTLPRSSDAEADMSHLIAKARIVTHYAFNRYFLGEQPLLAEVSKLPDVPITIVHGRRDLVCPFEAAWTLHQAIPGSRLVSVPDAGHLASEPPMIDALVAETDRLSGQDRPG